MRFAIGKVSYFESVGYNTAIWRKSVDGTKAICHFEKAEILCHENNIDVYESDSLEFKTLLASGDWLEPTEADESTLPEPEGLVENQE